MSNDANQSQIREYKIYIPSTHQFITVSKEFYHEYYRPIWRTQKAAQKRGQCMCPKSKVWCCDGCCVGCQYRAPGDVWSLDYEQELMGDTLEDTSPSVESIVTDQIMLEQLFARLDKLFPEARRIGELRMEGVSDRDVARIIGIPRSTFRSRLANIKSQLQKEYGDSF